MVLAHRGGLLLSAGRRGRSSPPSRSCAPGRPSIRPSCRFCRVAERPPAILARLASIAGITASWPLSTSPSSATCGRPSAPTGSCRAGRPSRWRSPSGESSRPRGPTGTRSARSECHFGDLLERTVAEARSGGPLVVVPAFFTHRGLIIDLPGVVVVGVRTDNTGAQARARTEALAHRLKAISDPTRLAILDALRGGPRTVGDIATAFALAQPTVSNHVKILREAQLVTDRRDGSSTATGRRPRRARTTVLEPAGRPARAGRSRPGCERRLRSSRQPVPRCRFQPSRRSVRQWRRAPRASFHASLTAATSLVRVSLASPNSSVVLSSNSSSLSMPANPGRIERLRKTMLAASSAWMMGMP